MSTIHELRRILGSCRTLAVVGLSPQWHRPSFFAAKYMQEHGYRIVPINPSASEILGQRSFPSVTAAAQALAKDGVAGKAYGARTTPHMYIVDPQGRLAYAGGIDSIPSANPEDVRKAVNYVRQGIAEASAGKPLSAATTRPYGCSVKYKS